MDSYETLRVEERAGVLRVVLDRPERHNSINDVMLDELGAMLDRAERGGPPIVALSTGGGVGLVAASDLVYATERSSFGLPEALWGLLPCCVLPFLIRRVGYQPAHAMTLSTMPVPALRAERYHLVDEVVEDADPVLRRLAVRLSKLDGHTVGDAKRYLGRMWPPPGDPERVATAEFARLVSSPAVQRRIANFANHQQMPWESR